MKPTEAFPGIAACTVVLALSLFAEGVTPAEAKESVLYRFNGGSDGDTPMAGMIADAAGNLYGTTSKGGGSTNCTSGCGTVFELSPPAQRDGTWTESVLYSFEGGDDGATPLAPLIADKSGNLYGVTSAGGGDCDNANMASCGTVFELVRPQHAGGAWTETLLYRFLGNPNGKGNGDLAWPNGLVFDNAGNLYGFAYSGGHCTTDETGTYCYGGAFSLTSQDSAWAEKVIYRFKGTSGAPAGPLLDSSGRLYGTAPGGAYGCGGVFRLTAPKGQGEWGESSLYDFQCGNDGAFPLPGLILDADGNLYDMSLGTAQGYGNIFELSPTQGGGWSESVLYDFTQLANGYTPSVGPIFGTNGGLYGTTQEGGQSNEGTVFELAPPRKHGHDWTEHVLHSFAGGSGGFAPYGGLSSGQGNAVYGTTPAGGNCCGTIFKVVP
jgi:uncharacterized repeat protein (TIGR03803 family)